MQRDINSLVSCSTRCTYFLLRSDCPLGKRRRIYKLTAVVMCARVLVRLNSFGICITTNYSTTVASRHTWASHTYDSHESSLSSCSLYPSLQLYHYLSAFCSLFPFTASQRRRPRYSLIFGIIHVKITGQLLRMKPNYSSVLLYWVT